MPEQKEPKEPKEPKGLNIKVEPTGKFYSDQKWVITVNNKKIPIGKFGLNDFTLYASEKERENYIARHGATEMRKDSVKRGKVIKHP
jgi:hypothetical protein